MRTILISTCCLLLWGCPDKSLEPEGPVPDGGVNQAAPQDAGVAPLNWTWARCRHAVQSESLTADDRQACDQLFRSPASQQRFGLNWIFLGQPQDTVDSYPETQLDDLNSIFAPNQMEFFVQSRRRIAEPLVTEGSRGDSFFRVSEIIADLRQYLGTDRQDPQDVVDFFNQELERVGVRWDPSAGHEPVTLTTAWKSSDFFRHIARLDPDHITVVVRNAQGEKSTGSFPRRGIDAPIAGLIFLSSPSALSALPHEMGHFFGLPHTHGSWSRQPGSVQDWQISWVRQASAEDWLDLQALAGESFDRDFQETYLPYDASDEALDAFENGQILARKVLGWTELTYQRDFEPVESDAAFVALLQAETPPKMKNFVRSADNGSFSGNNCGKSWTGEDRTTLRCKYGDRNGEPANLLFGDHPMLQDALLFNESTEANLMSYISTNIDDGQRRKKHLTERQRDLIRLGSRMPSRQRLRNYASP